jgi:hypothetical protein
VTKEELAAKLNGREYNHEITKEEEAEAKANGLVVIFGSSDDLMELRGAIYNEIGGTDTAYLTPKGLPANKCYNDDCPYFQKILDGIKDRVTAIWDEEEYSFVYETTMPHATFDIMEEGFKYCRGIVVEMPK